MHRIMNDEISAVAGDKSRKENISFAAEYNCEYKKEYSRKNDRYYRRHHQPVFVTRIFMMYTMNAVLDLQLFFSRCVEMKKKPVNKVFHETEQKHPGNKICHVSKYAEAIGADGVINEEDGNEEVKNYRDRKMRPRKLLQKTV